MNKKGLEVKTRIELILFVFIFFIAFTIGNELYAYFLGEPDSGTLKSLDALKLEIGSIEQNESRTVPIFIDSSHVIKGFFKNTKIKPTDCKPKLEGEQDKACFCICTAESCDQIKKEVSKCVKVDFDLKEEYTLRAKISTDNKAMPQNCVLKREIEGEASKIAISCS